MKTVATYPSAIFWLSFTCVTLALICVCLVRLPPNPEPSASAQEAGVDVDIESATVHLRPEREATLVDPLPESGVSKLERGRKAMTVAPSENADLLA